MLKIANRQDLEEHITKDAVPVDSVDMEVTVVEILAVPVDSEAVILVDMVVVSMESLVDSVLDNKADHKGGDVHTLKDLLQRRNVTSKLTSTGSFLVTHTEPSSSSSSSFHILAFA
jgi:hypothetical protein